MNNTRPLRIALLGNAVFSASSGFIIFTAPGWIGDLLGFEATAIFMLVGAGLLLFAADLAHQATRTRIRTWRALYASNADFLWVIGSIAGVLLFADLLSAAGIHTVASVAIIVLGFGLWQLWGIDYAHRHPETGQYPLYRHCIVIESNAPADALWSIIRDLGNISHYMTSLRESRMLNHQKTGVGAVRCCVNQAGQAWAEKCTVFNDSERCFSVRFLTQQPDFPFPASRMEGGWHVQPKGNGSMVTIWWELVPEPRLMAPLMLPILAYQVDRDFPKLIARMTNEAFGYKPEEDMDNSWQHSARLLPYWC